MLAAGLTRRDMLSQTLYLSRKIVITGELYITLNLAFPSYTAQSTTTKSILRVSVFAFLSASVSVINNVIVYRPGLTRDNPI